MRDVDKEAALRLHLKPGQRLGRSCEKKYKEKKATNLDLQDHMEVGDMEVGDMEVGDMEVGDMEVGDMEVGDMEVGDMEVGDMEVGDMDDESGTSTPKKISD